MPPKRLDDTGAITAKAGPVDPMYENYSVTHRKVGNGYLRTEVTDNADGYGENTTFHKSRPELTPGRPANAKSSGNALSRATAHMKKTQS